MGFDGRSSGGSFACAAVQSHFKQKWRPGKGVEYVTFSIYGKGGICTVLNRKVLVFVKQAVAEDTSQDYTCHLIICLPDEPDNP